MTISKKDFDPIPHIEAFGSMAQDGQDWPPGGQDPITFTIKCIMAALSERPAEERKGIEESITHLVETIVSSEDPRASALAALEGVWADRTIELLSPAVDLRLALEKETGDDARKALVAAVESLSPDPYFLHDKSVPHDDLATLLESIGEHGKSHAQKVRKRGPNPKLTKPWKKTEVLLWTVLLVEALWVDKVRPQLERERRKPPALVVAVHEPATHLLRRGHLVEEETGQTTIPIPGELSVRIAADAAAIGANALKMVTNGVKLLGSVAAHRVFRDVVFTAHRQALDGNPDPRLIRFDGGWKQYAEHLGMPGKKAADQVRDIIEAMHGTEIPLPTDRTVRLLNREYYPPRGRRKGRIILIAGTSLLPDYVQELQHAMRGALLARRATKLVPVLPIPPMAGHEYHHGAQATFSMMLVGHFREHAAELAEHGAIELDEATLRRLADAAGLSWVRVHPILDHWCEEHEEGPALLARVGSGYTLSDAHKVARDFIIAGGQRELDGAAAGRKANARKFQKIRRGRKGRG